MADLITPVPAGTPITTVAGALGAIPDTAGNDAMGLVTDSPAPNSLLGRLKAVAVGLAALLTQGASYGARTGITVGAAAITPGRALEVVATTAGNVALVLADGSTTIVPVNVGLSILPYAVKQIASAGTTATASFGVLA